MNIKHSVAFLAAILLGVSASAQKITENDEVFATVQGVVPMYKGIGADGAMVGIHYGHTWLGGFGYRAGFQYMSSISDVDNYFGFPVALTWRSRSRSKEERLESGAFGAAGSIFQNYDSSAGDIAKDAFASFMMNLFDRIEFYAGVTPGYMAGKSTSVSWMSIPGGYEYQWTEKPHSMALTLDAGMDLNYRVWRFDLKLMTAFHYSPLRTLVDYSSNYDPAKGPSSLEPEVRPWKDSRSLRWFFTFGAGFAYHF